MSEGARAVGGEGRLVIADGADGGVCARSRNLGRARPGAGGLQMQAKQCWGEQQSDFRGMHAKHGRPLPFGALSCVG